MQQQQQSLSKKQVRIKTPQSEKIKTFSINIRKSHDNILSRKTSHKKIDQDFFKPPPSQEYRDKTYKERMDDYRSKIEQKRIDQNQQKQFQNNFYKQNPENSQKSDKLLKNRPYSSQRPNATNSAINFRINTNNYYDKNKNWQQNLTSFNNTKSDNNSNNSYKNSYFSKEFQQLMNINEKQSLQQFTQSNAFQVNSINKIFQNHKDKNPTYFSENLFQNQNQKENYLNHFQNKEEQISISIEYCSNCQEHQNQHQQKDYFFEKLYNECYRTITKICQNAQISGIPIVNQKNKIGAFEVRNGNNLIWSSLLFQSYPDPEKLAYRIILYYNDLKNNQDVTKYQYKNPGIQLDNNLFTTYMEIQKQYMQNDDDNNSTKLNFTSFNKNNGGSSKDKKVNPSLKNKQIYSQKQKQKMQNSQNSYSQNSENQQQGQNLDQYFIPKPQKQKQEEQGQSLEYLDSKYSGDKSCDLKNIQLNNQQQQKQFKNNQKKQVNFSHNSQITSPKNTENIRKSQKSNTQINAQTNNNGKISYDIYELLNNIKDQLQTWQKCYQDFGSFLDKKNEKINDLEKSVQKLQQDIQQKDEEINNLEIEKQELEQEYKLEKQDYEFEISMKKDKIGQLQNTVDIKINEIKDKDMKLSNQLNRNSMLSSNYKQTQQTLNELNVKMQQSKMQSSKNKEQISQLQDQNDILTKKIENLKKDSKNMVEKIQELEISEKKLKEELKKTQEKLKQQKIDFKSSSQHTITELESTKKKLNQIVEQSKEDNQKLDNIFKPQNIFPKLSKITVEFYCTTHQQTKRLSNKQHINPEEEPQLIDLNKNENAIINIYFPKIPNHIKAIAFIVSTPQDDMAQILSGNLKIYNKGYICKQSQTQRIKGKKLHFVNLLVKQSEFWSLIDMDIFYNTLDIYDMVKNNILKSGIQLNESIKNILNFKPENSASKIRLLQGDEVPLIPQAYEKLNLAFEWSTKFKLDLNLNILTFNKDLEIQDNISFTNPSNSSKSILHYGQQVIKEGKKKQDQEIYQEEVVFYLKDLDKNVESIWIFISFQEKGQYFNDFSNAALKFLIDETEFCRFQLDIIKDKISNGLILCEFKKIGNRFVLKGQGSLTKNTETSDDVIPIIQDLAQHNQA
ncbi:hypothetical protein PPERSA_04342 [Pseudocohnilembus persalinus]|uniref:Uncharacterized protein n=1 Tax=Pseudocohnilembus persalinus TaxID=266149 RepID=A0A0V0QQG4_PSEPJ|nr:hypothetical protein PPERSA_04342 [Pseudocohnilembus persalinus]|eukprot:KRX04527.1 hypothetical protein PPERSA_04342 [Pseudocohnilembus persalinus]